MRVILGLARGLVPATIDKLLAAVRGLGERGQRGAPLPGQQYFTGFHGRNRIRQADHGIAAGRIAQVPYVVAARSWRQP
jgi:hypothetical protein